MNGGDGLNQSADFMCKPESYIQAILTVIYFYIGNLRVENLIRDVKEATPLTRGEDNLRNVWIRRMYCKFLAFLMPRIPSEYEVSGRTAKKMTLDAFKRWINVFLFCLAFVELTWNQFAFWHPEIFEPLVANFSQWSWTQVYAELVRISYALIISEVYRQARVVVLSGIFVFLIILALKGSFGIYLSREKAINNRIVKIREEIREKRTLISEVEERSKKETKPIVESKLTKNDVERKTVNNKDLECELERKTVRLAEEEN